MTYKPNFHQWTKETEDLATAIERMTVDYLISHPDTQSTLVIPACLLAAYRLYIRVCKKLGIAEDKANAIFAHQAKMTQLVHFEGQCAAVTKSLNNKASQPSPSFYQANDRANAAGAGDGDHQGGQVAQ